MKENKYFTPDEFKCKCGKCKSIEPPDELVDVLCETREHYSAPLIIKSGYRCPEHNRNVGGATNSFHTKGNAVDFTVKGVKTLDLYNYVILHYGDRAYGIAKKIVNDEYRGFVHLDTRGYKARWNYIGSLK